jgi:ADP-ribose pyrophosphatase YjhB (NUDIX family)
MIDGRRFARLRPGSAPAPAGFSTVPDGGMCLSAFLVIRPPGAEGRVLLGRLDPGASWSELGALDPSRVAAIGEKWMLPSSQLLLFESPEEAARRIVREQLAARPLPLEGPAVFSEAYRRPDSGSRDPHWDLHFVFRGRWTSERAPRVPVWKELAFVDLATIEGSEIARGQGDVLALAGFPTRATPEPARRVPRKSP